MYCNKCGNQCNQGMTYCTRCGNRLDFIYSQTFNNNPNNKNNYILIPVCILFLIVSGFFVTKIINIDSKSVYIDSSIEEELDDTQSVVYTEGKTVINNEKRYVKEINNINDVNSFIKEESATQRKSCPTYNNNLDINVENKFDIAGVNFCEIESGFATELSKVIEYYYNQFPAIKGFLNNFTITNGNGDTDEGVIAYYRPFFDVLGSDDGSRIGGKNSINMMANYFLDIPTLKAAVENSSKFGHFPPNATVVSPIAHEFGHYLSFIALAREYKLENVSYIDSSNLELFIQMCNEYGGTSHSKKLIEEAYNRYMKDTGSKITFDDFRATISKYAMAKDESTGMFLYDETIAEAVHDVYLNGNNAKQASKYINAVLIERLS